MPPPNPPPMPSQFGAQLLAGRRRLRRSAPRPPLMPGVEHVLGIPIDRRRKGSKQVEGFFTKSGRIQKRCRYGIPPCKHGSTHYKKSGRVCCRAPPRRRRRSSRPKRSTRRKRSSRRKRVSRRRATPRRRSSRRRRQSRR